jgi:Glycosyltransferase Family 4/Glycosyl transferases group 1
MRDQGSEESRRHVFGKRFAVGAASRWQSRGQTSTVIPARVVQEILYTNPDRLPPLINSTLVLAGSGFSVDIIARDYKRLWNIDYPAGTQIRRIKRRLPASSLEYLHFVLDVLRFADRTADVVVGNEMHGFLPARLLATLLRRPLVYRCHDFVESDRHISRGARFVRAFERRFARTADVVIVPDASRADVIRRELQLPRPPIVVANAPLVRPPRSSTALQEALSARGARFQAVVLRQGILGPGHAIEATIRSMPDWSSPDWGFVLLGFGQERYIDHLVSLARSLEVERRVIVLPPVSYHEVSTYTVGADVGHALYDPVNVNHRFMGTSSNKVMEYMAAGLPLLVSSSDSFRPYLERYACGLIADPDSPTSIAAAINSLLSSYDHRKLMGESAARAFDQVFSFDRQFAPALAAIDSLARNRNGARNYTS